MSPALAGRFFTTRATWEDHGSIILGCVYGNLRTRKTLAFLWGGCCQVLLFFVVVVFIFLIEV